MAANPAPFQGFCLVPALFTAKWASGNLIAQMPLKAPGPQHLVPSLPCRWRLPFYWEYILKTEGSLPCFSLHPPSH